jgi:hypothetical protein
MPGAPLYGRRREFATDNGAGVQVIDPGFIAEPVKVHTPLRVAWKGVASSGTGQAPEAQLVLRRLGIWHLVFLLVRRAYADPGTPQAEPY